MNYERIYERIIQKAKLENRKRGEGIYYERHHIKPQSLFKDLKKDPNNMVLLTPKEHFICHMLLSEIYPGKEMQYAIWRMCNDGKYKVSARYYDCVKKRISETTRELSKGRVPSKETRRKISEANKGKKRSEETKRKLRESYDPQKHVLTEDQRRILSQNASKRFKGVKKSENFKEFMRKNHLGNRNPMYGKPNKIFMSNEDYETYRKHLSQALMGHICTEETKRKIGEKTKKRVQGGNNPKAATVKIVELNMTFSTIKECSDFIGVNRNAIARNRKGNLSKVKNYTIEFI